MALHPCEAPWFPGHLWSNLGFGTCQLQSELVWSCLQEVPERLVHLDRVGWGSFHPDKHQKQGAKANTV